MVFVIARRLSFTVHFCLSKKMESKVIVFTSLFFILIFYFDFTFLETILTVFIVYVVTGGWKFIDILIKSGPRDVKALIFLIHAKKKMADYTKRGMTVSALFQETVQQHPNKMAFVEVDGKSYTFQEVEDLSNQVANYFHDSGFRHGDNIAVFMESSPQYVCIWLGLTKIGVCPALINFNLREDSLAHCINISEAKAVIYSAGLLEAMKEVHPLLSKSTRIFCYDELSPKDLMGENLVAAVNHSAKMKPPKDFQSNFNEKLFYVYTSGTTGLPKAAIVINSRFFYMAYSVHNFFKLRSDDVVYNTLPLYHTAGGVLGVGQALLQGCTVVIRKKFSASRFWDDCIKYNCTVCQYIGEICRYLLAQPDKPVDRQHRVRVAFGNGLRPKIWREFMTRFNIERIGEFYGATEGNANIINTDNTIGAVGFTTRIAPALYPVTLIKIDEVTGEPVRDRNGMCVICQPGEPGEMVGKIVKGDPLREFDGYVNRAATSKKIAHSVFKKGDSVFLTGDVLVMDNYGYMYFRDRTGDTFRWRGENVSTFEVESQVSKITRTDATVYGVEIPGVEGRAGMAAIVDENDNINLQGLYSQLQRVLPPYARPVFIRLLQKAEMTGTFKLKKTEYKKDNFNPSSTSDAMFYFDAKTGQYLPINKQTYDDICSAKIRF